MLYANWVYLSVHNFKIHCSGVLLLNHHVHICKIVQKHGQRTYRQNFWARIVMFLFLAHVVNRRSPPVSIALTSLRVTDDRVRPGATALARSIIYKQRVARKFSILVVVWTSICRRLARGEVEGERDEVG